MSLKSSW